MPQTLQITFSSLKKSLKIIDQIIDKNNISNSEMVCTSFLKKEKVPIESYKSLEALITPHIIKHLITLVSEKLREFSNMSFLSFLAFIEINGFSYKRNLFNSFLCYLNDQTSQNEPTLGSVNSNKDPLSFSTLRDILTFFETAEKYWFHSFLSFSSLKTTKHEYATEISTQQIKKNPWEEGDEDFLILEFLTLKDLFIWKSDSFPEIERINNALYGDFNIVTKSRSGCEISFDPQNQISFSQCLHYTLEILQHLSKSPGTFICVFSAFSFIEFFCEVKSKELDEIAEKKPIFVETGALEDDRDIFYALEQDTFFGRFVFANFYSLNKCKFRNFNKVVFGLPNYDPERTKMNIAHVFGWFGGGKTIFVEADLIKGKFLAGLPKGFIKAWKYGCVDISVDQSFFKL